MKAIKKYGFSFFLALMLSIVWYMILKKTNTNPHNEGNLSNILTQDISKDKMGSEQYVIVPDYEDPFFASIISVKKSEESPSDIKKFDFNKAIQKPSFTAPNIVYQGHLKSGNRLLALIKNNGKHQILDVEDSLEDYLLLKIHIDSLTFKKGEQVFYITRNTRKKASISSTERAFKLPM